MAAQALARQHAELADRMAGFEHVHAELSMLKGETEQQRADLVARLSNLDTQHAGLASLTSDINARHAGLTRQLSSLEGKLADAEAGISVALMALKIDKENAARDPEAAAAAANLLSNGMLFKVWASLCAFPLCVCVCVCVCVLACVCSCMCAATKLLCSGMQYKLCALVALLSSTKAPSTLPAEPNHYVLTPFALPAEPKYYV